MARGTMKLLLVVMACVALATMLFSAPVRAEGEDSVDLETAEAIMRKMSDECRTEARNALENADSEDTTEVSEKCKAEFEQALTAVQAERQEAASGGGAAGEAAASEGFITPETTVILFTLTGVAGIAYYIYDANKKGKVPEYKRLSKRKEMKKRMKGGYAQ
mmetsp:Transcript_117983/g.327992  ORF Transcript_117983/g.327992 Transcript_117983/m.327992 type:complete len:162 (-) Transcript_117983:218-703(-)